MTEKEAIEARHSVRTYLDRKIEVEKVGLIVDKIKELNEAGDLNLQFIEDAGKTYNLILNRTMGLATAPSVVACVGKDSDDLDMRVGYYGEQLVIYLQQLGLNTCWTGIFNKKKVDAKIDAGERLVLCIAVGYGKDQGRPRRSKSAEQVSDGREDRPEWFTNGIKYALLAPTAVNQQKFRITLREDDTVGFEDLGGHLSRVDLGIVKYHFEVGANRNTFSRKLHGKTNLPLISN